MKLLNYDAYHLISENLKQSATSRPDTFTQAQYRILCSLIIRKGIRKDFFNYLLLELHGLEDWKKMDYQQMYRIIWNLSHWDYKKEKGEHMNG